MGGGAQMYTPDSWHTEKGSIPRRATFNGWKEYPTTSDAPRTPHLYRAPRTPWPCLGPRPSDG